MYRRRNCEHLNCACLSRRIHQSAHGETCCAGSIGCRVNCQWPGGKIGMVLVRRLKFSVYLPSRSVGGCYVTASCTPYIGVVYELLGPTVTCQGKYLEHTSSTLLSRSTSSVNSCSPRSLASAQVKRPPVLLLFNLS